MTDARVLVTGGAGFIGSHLVDLLVDEGRAVTVLDDFSTGSIDNLSGALESGDVRIVRGSVLSLETVEAATQDCDAVYHLAVECVRRSLGAPLKNHEVNATGTLNVLEAARRGEVTRFVYCSSSEVYGNATEHGLLSEKSPCEPVTVYGAAKLAGEYYAKAYWQTYRLPVIIVRPFNAYGPREHDRGDLAEVIPRFVIRILNGHSPILFGDGTNGRDFTYVTETARGLALAGASDRLIGNVVNIACGRMVQVRELAETIARLCQRPDLRPVEAPPRPGDVRVLHADTRFARDALAFEAAIDIETGLERYISWFRQTYPDPSALLEADAVNWQMPK